EHRLDRLRGVALTFTHDKTRGSAVTMGSPYVLLGNGPVDHVNIGVEARIMGQMPYEAAIKGGEADCILDARAEIGNAQFKRWLAEGGPNCPPDETCIPDDGCFGQGADIGIVTAVRLRTEDSRNYAFNAGG